MRLLVVACVCVALAACGFQLRRDVVLPSELSAIRIESAEPTPELTRALEVVLRRSGAAIQTADATTGASLRITSASLVPRPLSVSGDGRVQEFALMYQVDIELSDAQGAIRVPKQTVRLERVYSFDAAAALGTPGEEEIVREELEREMVASIMRRIEAALAR
ncbi:MAG: LPS-assembly lipoprotein LptE [Pseudomarimonas sp.]